MTAHITSTPTETLHSHRPETGQTKAAWLSLVFALAIAYFHWFPSPVQIAYDPHEEQCLPDVHLALIVRSKPETIGRGDLLIWKPSGSLSYVRQEYVMKRVAAIEGDHLVVRDGLVTVNDQPVTQGMALLDLEKTSPQAFDRDLIVPKGKLYMMGTHPNSNDSRYWGWLDVSAVVGTGHKIL
jgi:conjugal transfer pilin signal peptidase TrbI